MPKSKIPIWTQGRVPRRNISNLSFLPVVGINVYDILKFNNLIISKDALTEVEKRLI